MYILVHRLLDLTYGRCLQFRSRNDQKPEATAIDQREKTSHREKLWIRMSAASNDIQWRCLGLTRSMVGLTTRFPQRLAKQFSLHDHQVAAKDTHQGRFWRRRLGPFGITIERLHLVCLPVAIACTECRGKENIDNTTLVAPRFFIMIHDTMLFT